VLIVRRRCFFPFVLLFMTSAAPADDDSLGSLRAVGKEGANSPAARAAWDKLIARGPAVLPDLLQAMNTSDTVAANWLRTAFDRIVEDEMKNGGKALPADSLLAFAKEPRHSGRARRLALEVVERLQPGTSAGLFAEWLEDPEFRYEAVALALKKAESIKDKEAAVAAFRAAFAASRDLQQARLAATHLKAHGVEVSVADHMGFLRDWYCVGPFDAKGMKGFRTVYPPESGKVDLTAEYDGKEGKVRWKRYQVREPPPNGGAAHVALVNLREPLGDAADAVGYAYTAIEVAAPCEAEFRGAADDNFTIWVNGKRVFGFEEYRNGVRLDRHRFKVTLQAGVNTILVKICQAPMDASNTEPNWEFLLRIVDATGKGLVMKNALPALTKEK
jgi:hypothetical protein